MAFSCTNALSVGINLELEKPFQKKRYLMLI